MCGGWQKFLWMGEREGERVVFLIHDRFGASVPSPPTRGWEGGGGWDGDDDVWHVLLRTRRCSPGLFPGREGSNFLKRLTCVFQRGGWARKKRRTTSPLFILSAFCYTVRGGWGEVR